MPIWQTAQRMGAFFISEEIQDANVTKFLGWPNDSPGDDMLRENSFDDKKCHILI